MGKNGLLNVVRRVITSPLTFRDDNGVRRFDQAWLSEARDIVEGKSGNVD